MRGQFRAHVKDEVKRVALTQLADGGPQALSVNAIAKELGVSGPALYRYFASRDDLLTALVIDAYHDLAVALATAAGGRGLRAPGRLRALLVAYRAWAVEQPHRYRLMFAAPVPGYDAQSRRLVEAAREAMNVLLDVLSAIVPEGTGTGTAALDRQLAQWLQQRATEPASPAAALRAVIIWGRLHGLVSLEIERNYASLGIEPDRVFAAEVDAILRLAAAP